jgi:hypothetical protein
MIVALMDGMAPSAFKYVQGRSTFEMTMPYIALNTADLQTSHSEASPMMRLRTNSYSEEARQSHR